MNKNIGIVIAVVALVGLGFLFTKSKPSATPSAQNAVESNTANVSTSVSDGSTFTGSPSELAKRGGNFKCMVNASATTGGTTGTIFVSGQKISGTFTTLVEGKSVESRMVMDGGYNYFWTSAYPQGMKMKIAAAESTGAPTASGMMNMDQNYAYNCEPWSPDASTFTLPSTVTFMEMQAQ